MLIRKSKPDAERPPPTEEQALIVDALRGTEANLMVNALAGTGKTTTLELLQEASKTKPILYLAFNKRVKEEAERKFPKTTLVKTFNGFGHSAWQRSYGNLEVDGKKLNTIFKEYANGLKGDERKETWEVYWEVLQACQIAKHCGYVPEGKYPNAKRLSKREDVARRLEKKPDALTLQLLDHILHLSIQAAYKRWVDFDDQVYMPTLFGGTFPRFPLALIDEDQDLNLVNHEMLARSRHGRLALVGDRWQSIYAFRGAVTSGVQRLKERFNCTEYDLSLCFRCPEAVVEEARWRAPNLRAAKSGGSVKHLKQLEASSIPDTATFICRNNAPLFRLALRLLASRRPVSIAGSEIGPKVARLLEKVCHEDDNQDQMLGHIADWRVRQLDEASEHGRAVIEDTAECLQVFASFGRTRSEAIAYLKHLFEQRGSIYLTTAHKAKGGEWPIVYFLDPWLAKETDLDEQVLNLRYVVQTRAQEALYYIDSEAIRW